MIFGLLRDTAYNIVLFVHVLAVIIASTGAVAHPMMFALEQQRDDADLPRLAQRIETPSRVYSIAFVLAGVVGFALVSMGDWPWSDVWIWASILFWVAATGLLHGVVVPAERAIAGGDTTALAKMDRFGPIVAVLMLATVFLMTVKPGGSALAG